MNTMTKMIYWVTILSACTMGETAGDFVSFGLNFGYAWASVLLITLLIVALIVEARAKAPNEIRYWTTIVIMSTTGTALADFLTRTLRLGYGWGATLLISLFGMIYFVERLVKSKISDGPLHADADSFNQVGDKNQTQTSIIPTTDAFYWAAILVASTFGTAMGDFVSDMLKFGFLGGTIFLDTLLAIVLIFEFRAKTSNKPRYWTALVITSTIGATNGDFLTKPDGLNLGYTWGSAVLIAVFAVIFFLGRRLKPATASINSR